VLSIAGPELASVEDGVDEKHIVFGPELVELALVERLIVALSEFKDEHGVKLSGT
jgi:hypothetical protein